MKELEPSAQSKAAYEAISVINKLLAIPLGEQIYRKEIGILFKMVELINTPIFVVDDRNSSL